MRLTRVWLAVLLSAGLSSHPAWAGASLVLGRHAVLARTVVVSPGATGAEGGANLQNALESASGTADQPVRLKLEPGIYDLGASFLDMKPHVDIEGSGQGVTVIQSALAGTNGVVRGRPGAEIRHLTVRNTFSGADFCVGISNVFASPVVRDVAIEVLGGCQEPMGIYSQESDPVLMGVSVRVAGALTVFGIRQDYGVLQATDLSVEAASSTADQSVYATLLLAAGTEAAPCRLENVRSAATGGKIAYGLRLGSSVLEAGNAAFRASGAVLNYGIYLHNTASVAVSGSTAAAEGGSQSTGVEINNGSASFTEVTMGASGASGASAGNSGLRCVTASGAKRVDMDRCRIGGASYSIYESDADYTLYAGASQLDGPVSRKGTWHCAQCYDGANGELNEVCQ